MKCQAFTLFYKKLLEEKCSSNVNTHKFENLMNIIDIYSLQNIDHIYLKKNISLICLIPVPFLTCPSICTFVIFFVLHVPLICVQGNKHLFTSKVH